MASRASFPHAVVFSLLLASPVLAQQHEQPRRVTEKLGKVVFSTSCTASAQPLFNRAVALLHSFEFARAIEAFTATLKADPSCGMAEWGIALSRWGNPFAAGLRPPAQLAQGRDAVNRAKAIGLKTAARRRTSTRYRSCTPASRRSTNPRASSRIATRWQGRREQPERHRGVDLLRAGDCRRRPADRQDLRGPAEGRRDSRASLASQPDHPGLAHYIIHSYDVPPLADRALEAARRYAKIAPSAPHALHMPSHTFTRVGYWQESIDTNIASGAVAKREGSTAEELHAMDYRTYAYLQTAQDARGPRRSSTRCPR